MEIDPDDVLFYRGKLISRMILFNQMKSKGWTQDQFAQVDDEQIEDVMSGAITPANFTPSQDITISKSSASEGVHQPATGGYGGSIKIQEGLSLPDDWTPPPSPDQDSGLLQGGRNGNIMSLPQIEKAPDVAEVMEPEETGDPSPNPKPRTIPLPVNPHLQQQLAPRAEYKKMLAIMAAAAQLEGQVARDLLESHDLQQAFATLYSDKYRSLYGEDSIQEDTGVGSVILAVEMNQSVCHIITNHGVLTFTGSRIQKLEMEKNGE